MATHTMLSSLSLVLVVIGNLALAPTSATGGYQEPVDDDEHLDVGLLERLREAKRGTQCAGTGGNCFNSGQCCSGLVCAALDKEAGEKPEVPGYCVKNKDLQACSAGPVVDGDDCPDGQRCAILGRMGQSFCLPIRENKFLELKSIKTADRRRYHSHGGTKANGKLGSACASDADCAPSGEDGLYKMCCQLVNRARQGTKRICDRVTQISTCIRAP